ncbi:uncharacterized protein LOC122090997 [Macadamia integrifolia]|uniref:uncharacterized protein LOC122090997 n=1 Tax=Macadamia integrifolia TaxID=60698 RepID=UPI001C4E3D4A|nr:uncharacterized protein LOC122090997 [Macadamia integrifolia]
MISTERSIAMTNQPRRVLTPGASRKRKEREVLHKLKPSTTNKADPAQDLAPAPDPASSSSNRLLAGYLAHEFLTQGTLFGQKWDPAPAKAAPVEVAKNKAVYIEGAEQSPAAAHQRYAAVAKLMKVDGTHIAGIVNPTQLARWIQM